MEDSILGNDLPKLKAQAFQRRFAFVMMHLCQVTRRADLDFLRSVGRQVRAARGNFMPGDEQGKWLVDIEGRIRGGADLKKLQDKLIKEAREIIRDGRLESGKLLRLAPLTEAGQHRELSHYELLDLQYLVFAVGDHDAEP